MASPYRTALLQRVVLTVLLWSIGGSPQAAQAQASASKRNSADFHLDLYADLGGSSSRVPQPLPADWLGLFMPPNDLMTTNRSDHAWFVELGAALEPAFAVKRWRIGVPVSYSFLGSAATAGATARRYVYRKPVAGTKLEWWNPVLLHATAVQKTSPAVGVSLQRGDVLLQASVQGYRILGEDFRGEDCSGCENTSHLVTVHEFDRGLGYRLDVLFQNGGGESAGPGLGVFFERNGPQVWQLGARLRLRFTLAERRGTQ